MNLWSLPSLKCQETRQCSHFLPLSILLIVGLLFKASEIVGSPSHHGSDRHNTGVVLISVQLYKILVVQLSSVNKP